MFLLYGVYVDDDEKAQTHWLYKDTSKALYILSIFELDEKTNKLNRASDESLDKFYEALTREENTYETQINIHSPLFGNTECYMTPKEGSKNYMINFIMGYGDNDEEAKKDCEYNFSFLKYFRRPNLKVEKVVQ